jgi:DNA-binding NtrC family response regulator
LGSRAVAVRPIRAVGVRAVGVGLTPRSLSLRKNKIRNRSDPAKEIFMVPNRELGREVRAVTLEAMDLLRSYPWPGNIRELQSVLKQTLLGVTGPVVTAESIPASVSAYAVQPRAEETAPLSGSARSAFESFLRQELQEGGEDLYQHVHRQVDQRLLPLVLQTTGGNQLRAAQLLGITRRTLRLKLRDLGLSITKTVESSEGDDVD